MEGQIVVQEKPSPAAALLQVAIEKGAELEKLERLLDLQLKWEANEARKAYTEAMANFKRNPPEIVKDKSVNYTLKTGASTNYKHASLANVTTQINKALSPHGLSSAWRTAQDGKGITITCTITHCLGHSESTSLTASADDTGSKNSIQAIGSTITYLERYTLLALTGLATHDQDDDGVSSEFINENQFAELSKMVSEVYGDKPEGFLKYMGVETISEIPANKYKTAMGAINSVKERMAKK